MGWVNNFGYCVMLSAAKDLLNGRAPTSVVLFCDVMPTVIVKLLAPLFLYRIPLVI